MPAIRWRKKPSPAKLRSSRAMTSPTAPARLADSALAATLGRHPRSLATALTRALVESETPGLSLRAKETAPGDTPASLAMSLIVVLSMKSRSFSKHECPVGGLGASSPEAHCLDPARHHFKAICSDR